MPQNPNAPALIVGLGNPGTKYARTRHNIGFETIEALAALLRAPSFLQKFHAETSELSAGIAGFPQKVLLMKPTTYMNLSGTAVGEATTFFKIPPENVLVVGDDIDLPPGALRIRLSGGSGGHNGLKSITEVLGTDQFPRFRLGVGRSPHAPADAHVLAKIPSAEWELYAAAAKHAADALAFVLKEGLAKAMNTFNRKETKL